MNEKTNLLVMVGSFSLGGTERYVHQIITLLSRQKFRIDLALLQDGPCPYPGGIPSDVKVTILPAGLRSQARAVRNLVKQRSIDVIYSTCLDTGLAGLFGSIGIKGVRRVVGHRGMHTTYSRGMWLKNHLMNQMASAIIPNATAINETMLSNARDKSYYVPNFIDSNAVEFLERDEARARIGSLAQTDVVIGSIGRMERVKGHDVLIDAFAMITASNSDVRLVIVGDGKERDRLRSNARNQNVYDKILFSGDIPDAPVLMKAFDIFVLPSRSEGMPRALMEAMAAGIPCIASNAGGIKDLITDGEHGLLVPPENPVALARAMEALLKDNSMARQFGENGRIRMETEFSRDRIMKLTEELLSKK